MDLETFTSRRNFSVLSGFNLDIVGIQEFILKIPHKPLTNYNIEIGYNGEELGTTIIFKKDLTLTESEKSDSVRIMKVVLDGIIIINVYGYQPGLGAGAKLRNNMFIKNLPKFIPGNCRNTILMGDFNANLLKNNKEKGADIPKSFKLMIDGIQLKHIRNEKCK
jgi:hypothetical protein